MYTHTHTYTHLLIYIAYGHDRFVLLHLPCEGLNLELRDSSIRTCLSKASP